MNCWKEMVLSQYISETCVSLQWKEIFPLNEEMRYELRNRTDLQSELLILFVIDENG